MSRFLANLFQSFFSRFLFRLSCFLNKQLFCGSLYRLSFAWNCGWLILWEGEKFNLQRAVARYRQWFFPKMLLFCECNITLYSKDWSEYPKRGIGANVYLCWRCCLATHQLKLNAKWVQERTNVSFHMERKRPKQSSKCFKGTKKLPNKFHKNETIDFFLVLLTTTNHQYFLLLGRCFVIMNTSPHQGKICYGFE